MTEAADDSRSGPSLDSTSYLIGRVRAGDAVARERLFARYLPVVKRWARNRLPTSSRDIAETDDLVQVTLMRALSNLDTFDPRGPGAFLAYLRQILLNAVRDQLRRGAARRERVQLDTDVPDRSPSPLELAVGSETLALYEGALMRLRPEDREAVILRVEMALSFVEIADALGKPSADAARMAVGRALVRLAESMDEEEQG